MADTKRPLRVFLCHASGDKAAVLKIYERLVKDEVDAWLDSKKLIPGQNWQNEISKAVINSDIVIVCLSPHSITKEGFVQKEIRFALDVADEKPENTIFIIPAKLEVCDVPERLNRFQWVDLFSDEGYDRLIQALVLRADKVGAQIKQKKNQVKIPMGSQPRSKESANSKPTFGNAPPPPSLIVGREDTLRDIKTRLTVTSALVQAVTTVHGWPGVGKTTIAAALAHDPEISVAFPDGILWASLGTAPDIFHELSIWNRTLGVDNLMQINSIQELSA